MSGKYLGLACTGSLGGEQLPALGKLLVQARTGDVRDDLLVALLPEVRSRRRNGRIRMILPDSLVRTD